ncbi:hypothetical protein GPDM_05216 [Planococcus donghaensis MPA1U2]|uniref:Uncharacterized protein n=1 Tax=Planococcus donghaensis MPA1U2 TaxID=933115 RepID=E7RF01_9BACL|nr:hypothetical protein [Planococcus donghaensis]EGA90400.1 hypothetical protein GPDM_05216 [Planococcus donghaensis MPA1U2]
MLRKIVIGVPFIILIGLILIILKVNVEDSNTIVIKETEEDVANENEMWKKENLSADSSEIVAEGPIQLIYKSWSRLSEKEKLNVSSSSKSEEILSSVGPTTIEIIPEVMDATYFKLQALRETANRLTSNEELSEEKRIVLTNEFETQLNSLYVDSLDLN